MSIAKYIIVILLVFGITLTAVTLQPTQATTIIGFGGVIVAVFINILTQAVANKENTAATKQVAVTLETESATTQQQLKELAKVSFETHLLVNSAMGKQLHLGAELARWKANQTRDGVDIKAAIEAERLLEEHLGKQSILDKENKK